MGLGNLEEGATEGLGVFGGANVLELKDPTFSLGSAGSYFEGLIVDVEDAARIETVGEVGERIDDDAASEAEWLDDPADGDGIVGHSEGILYETRGGTTFKEALR